jgi:hypothetical protein
MKDGGLRMDTHNNVVRFPDGEALAGACPTGKELVQDFLAIAAYIETVAVRTKRPLRTLSIVYELRFAAGEIG